MPVGCREFKVESNCVSIDLEGRGPELDDGKVDGAGAELVMLGLGWRSSRPSPSLKASAREQALN